MVDRLVNTEANDRRIAFVEQCFGTSGQPLAVPSRVLVGEGVLTKKCRKKCKPRQFFLFNDVLVYGNIVISKKKYNKQHIIALEEVKLENVEDESSSYNGWKIISPSKSFVVYAATGTEKTQWMTHIKKCVGDLLLKNGITQNTDQDSPVWVPDSDAAICMHCMKTQLPSSRDGITAEVAEWCCPTHRVILVKITWYRQMILLERSHQMRRRMTAQMATPISAYLLPSSRGQSSTEMISGIAKED
ncbi:hypothetical protein ScPMuIL_016385 [Solemya velum]